MADTIPPAGGDAAVVAAPASDAWTLTLLRAGWPIQGAVLVLVSIVILFAAPDRMGTWMQPLPVLAAIVGAQGAVAFAGPAWKRAQEGRDGGGG